MSMLTNRGMDTVMQSGQQPWHNQSISTLVVFPEIYCYVGYSQPLHVFGYCPTYKQGIPCRAYT
eukprot:13609954-Ditylum_brightwellii.AAC.1